tara:strand:- start:572 stop:814 length:243 start_codon:yes stop_codon:yes gene_type:complete
MAGLGAWFANPNPNPVPWCSPGARSLVLAWCSMPVLDACPWRMVRDPWALRVQTAGLVNENKGLGSARRDPTPWLAGGWP